MPPCRFETPAPEEDSVYGACAPGRDRNTAPTVGAWISFMQANDIERVCCLLSDQQVRKFDGLLQQYRAAFGDERVSHVPITDHTLVDETTLSEEILSCLGRAVDADEPIVVHCLAGIGRTGQALAAWLVHAHGYDPAEAVETVTHRHRQPADAVNAGNATRAELLSLLETARG